MTAEAIYTRLPVLLQQAACSVEGWRIRRHRYGSRFEELLRQAEERMTWPEDRLLEYRDRRLKAFLELARRHVLYYQGAESLDQPLDKDTVRQSPSLFRSTAYRTAELRPVHTSGTTGGGLRFWATTEALQEQWAVWWRYRRWHGLQPATPCGYFGGRAVVPVEQSQPPFWRYDLAGRQILFSASHFHEAHLPSYVNELRRRRPPWLHGYPSLLALLAAYVLDRGLDLGYRLQWITTGAENLLPQQTQLMTRAFGVRPRQHYGMAEAVANASECEAGRLHIDEDFSMVELMPVQTAPGVCKVTGTNFTNPATPLIRYGVNDHVTPSAGACSCGRPGRVLERIDGRLEDYVVLADGRRLGRLDHIFKDLVAVREAQIVQRVPGEVTLRVVRSRGYDSADEQRLLTEARMRLGASTRIDLEYIDRVERSATGKLRFVVTHVAGGKAMA